MKHSQILEFIIEIITMIYGSMVRNGNVKRGKHNLHEIAKFTGNILNLPRVKILRYLVLTITLPQLKYGILPHKSVEQFWFIMQRREQ